MILAITSGEPAGVGPELCAALVQRDWPARLVVIGDRQLIAERVHAVAPDVPVLDYAPGAAPTPGSLEVLHVPLAVPAVAGRLDAANGRYVLDVLDRAIAGCKSGEFAGMVTAPVHKGIICEAGVPFSGHTEYLAEATATPLVVMMLVGGGLRVALATTHLPLKDVPAAITRPLLTDTLRILHADLSQRFSLPAPRILVAGLNPHAGEGGHMGTEEIEVITPVLDALRAEGMKLIGPLPADTLFVPHTLQQGDAVLAMYHDQGLPVLKYSGFERAVNVTLGLPYPRVAVDHGTALDLAGQGLADPSSLEAAVATCARMAAQRQAR